MAYVDLNPIRVKMAVSHEKSDHTCIKARIESLQSGKKNKRSIENFVDSNPEATGLPFVLRDYLELVDWSGRIIRQDKRGAIETSLPAILERLSLDQEAWVIRQFGSGCDLTTLFIRSTAIDITNEFLWQ